MSRRANGLFAVVVVAAALAWALPFRQPDCNTGSHFALVQTLARGSRTIDRIHGQSCDISWWRGHYYANKAPGLALVTVPWYLLVKAVSLLRPDPDAHGAFPHAMRAMPRRDIWLMGLWGSVLPSLGLLVLVRRLTDRFSPGSGTVAAAILAFATLLSPFGGLFFSHALSAFLAFAAFATAATSTSRSRVAAAGLLAGAAVVVEYPNAIIALVVGCYAVARGRSRARTALAYGVGFLAGIAPLIAYGWWTFGTPLHLSYVGAVLIPGVTGHDVLGANAVGFFGVGLPGAGRAIAILAGGKGLLTVSPILAFAPWGTLRLWRSGWRREVVAIDATVALYLIYNAGYYSPLGGATPGPRFLIAILPFLSIAVAASVREHLFATAALTVASALVLVAAVVTQPLISPPYSTGDWWHWVMNQKFTSTIVAASAHSWPGAVLIALAIAAGLSAGAVSLADRPPLRGTTAGLIALAAWCCLLLGFEELSHSTSGRLAILGSLVALLASVRLKKVGVVTAAGVALAVALATNPEVCMIITAAISTGALILLVARRRAAASFST